MYDNTFGPSEMKQQVLRNLKASTPGVLACSICSTDGFAVASELASSIKDDRVAALTAALYWIGQQTTQDLVQGPLQRVYVECEYGDMMVMGAGPEFLLSALISKDAKFSLVCFQMERAAKELAEIAMQGRFADSGTTPVLSNAFDEALSGELSGLPVGG